MDLDEQNGDQKFVFVPFAGPEGSLDKDNPKGWQDHYLLAIAGARDHYLTVKDNSVVLAYYRYPFLQPDYDHCMFRLYPAGNGFYRIMAVHSKNFLDVWQAATKAGAEVRQHPLTTTDNQLFMLVPTQGQGGGSSPIPDKEYVKANEDLRNVALAVAGKVPEVGGGLTFLVGQFWEKHDEMKDLWNQMKEYVDERVKQLIDENDLRRLTLDLRAHIDNLISICSDETEGLKGNNIDQILKDIHRTELEVLEKSPEKVFPYIVVLGTFIITVQHALLVNYEILFGAPSRNAIKSRVNVLNKSIEKYTNVLGHVKDELLKRRMWEIKEIPFPLAPEMVSIEDKYMTGWKMLIVKNAKEKTNEQFIYEQYRDQVMKQYGTEVDDHLMIGNVWKYFKAKLPANIEGDNTAYLEAYKQGYEDIKNNWLKKRETTIEIGIFGVMAAHTKFAAEPNKKITEIVLHSKDDRLCGIEVYYDGRSGGLKGKTGHADSYKLKDGEYIASVYGNSDGGINGLWLQTQHGHVVGCGNERAIFFSADIADAFNARLTAISGAYHDDKIEQLSFHWTYQDA